MAVCARRGPPGAPYTRVHAATCAREVSWPDVTGVLRAGRPGTRRGAPGGGREGVRLPRSALALKAAAYARASCPAFLFNHCMRTFLFGALKLQRRQLRYRADAAFVGAALHDLGLLPPFESPHASFETDGADAAERWLRGNGASAADTDLVWHEIQMHDGPWALTRRAGAEAQLVALGAGIDVDGPDPDELGQREIAEVVAAFPRLAFKREFTALLDRVHTARASRSRSVPPGSRDCAAHTPATRRPIPQWKNASRRPPSWNSAPQ